MVLLNWLQKICQSVPPTYVGIGHGYKWDDKSNKYVEEWRHLKTDPIILWYYEDGQIKEQTRDRSDTNHLGGGEHAQGRIDVRNNIGSVSFFKGWSGDPPDNTIRRHIMNALVNKYPGVQFVVYGVEKNRPLSLQEYWTRIEEGQA